MKKFTLNEKYRYYQSRINDKNLTSGQRDYAKKFISNFDRNVIDNAFIPNELLNDSRLKVKVTNNKTKKGSIGLINSTTGTEIDETTINSLIKIYNVKDVDELINKLTTEKKVNKVFKTKY